MELRQLAYLVAVAEEGSFTRAATRVHVAQPGVSAQVRQLERELGQTLLDRSGRHVTPTDVGAAVLPHAREALSAVESVREAVQELSGLIRGRVRVGMVAAPGAFEIANLLAGFHAAHPGVEISLLQNESAHLLRGLNDGSLDLALIGVSGPAPAGVERQVILDDRLMAGVHLEHPLADRREVTLEMLAHQPLICVPRGTGMRSALREGCASIGVEPQIAFEAADPRVLAQLAARRLGVAILPESAAGLEPSLRMLAIARPQMRSRIELAWRAEGAQSPIAPAARTLIAAARAFFADARAARARLLE
jgi:DNA-binding transcriptional LysR family regulator